MHKYVVRAAEQITPSTLLLTLDNGEPGRDFVFEPGQYAAFNFYKRFRPTPARCFSIVSSPTDKDVLQFSMRTRGHFTRGLARLQPGDVVKVRGPFGGFVLDPAVHNNVVLLAGGIGITPFMSMISFAVATQADTRITLLYSVQNQDDVPFKDELLQLQAQNPNFRVGFVIGQGPTDKLAGQQVASGFISGEVLDGATDGDYSQPAFFICGPPPFMRGMIKTLHAKGAPKHQILTEAFSQGPNRQTGKVVSWPFNMYALTAVGVMMAGVAVTISDLWNNLPPSQLFGSDSASQNALTNSRQESLDTLVNSLAATNSSAPASPAAQAAQNQPTTVSQAAPVAPTPVYTPTQHCSQTSRGMTCQYY